MYTEECFKYIRKNKSNQMRELLIWDKFKGPQTVRISQFVGELNPKVYKRSSVRYKPTLSKNKTSKEKKALLFTTADKLGKK